MLSIWEHICVSEFLHMLRESQTKVWELHIKLFLISWCSVPQPVNSISFPKVPSLSVFISPTVSDVFRDQLGLCLCLLINFVYKLVVCLPPFSIFLVPGTPWLDRLEEWAGREKTSFFGSPLALLPPLPWGWASHPSRPIRAVHGLEHQVRWRGQSHGQSRAN